MISSLIILSKRWDIVLTCECGFGAHKLSELTQIPALDSKFRLAFAEDCLYWRPRSRIRRCMARKENKRVNTDRKAAVIKGEKQRRNIQNRAGQRKERARSSDGEIFRLAQYCNGVSPASASAFSFVIPSPSSETCFLWLRFRNSRSAPILHFYCLGRDKTNGIRP